MAGIVVCSPFDMTSAQATAWVGSVFVARTAMMRPAGGLGRETMRSMRSWSAMITTGADRLKPCAISSAVHSAFTAMARAPIEVMAM